MKEEMKSMRESTLTNTESTPQDTVATIASDEIAALAYQLWNERVVRLGHQTRIGFGQKRN